MTYNFASGLYELPPLPFGDVVLPGISKATVDIHYGRHHRAYVAKLNTLMADSPMRGLPLEDVIREADGTLFNNAAQAWNHSFYWNCLTPEGGRLLPGVLASRIERDFGSLDVMLDKFRASALAKFGSGWTWLVVDATGRLSIENTDDAQCPLRLGRKPLLTCDVWEHAYYIDYQNERARYVDAFLQLVNWNFVAGNILAS